MLFFFKVTDRSRKQNCLDICPKGMDIQREEGANLCHFVADSTCYRWFCKVKSQGYRMVKHTICYIITMKGHRGPIGVILQWILGFIIQSEPDVCAVLLSTNMWSLSHQTHWNKYPMLECQKQTLKSWYMSIQGTNELEKSAYLWVISFRECSHIGAGLHSLNAFFLLSTFIPSHFS